MDESIHFHILRLWLLAICRIIDHLQAPALLSGGWAHSICPVPLLYFSTFSTICSSSSASYSQSWSELASVDCSTWIWIIITIPWLSCCFLGMWWSHCDRNEMKTSCLISQHQQCCLPTTISRHQHKSHHLKGSEFVDTCQCQWYISNMSLHLRKQSPELHHSGDSTAKLTLSLIETLDKLYGPRVKLNCSSQALLKTSLSRAAPK